MPKTLITLQNLLDDPQLSFTETLQPLWSGYGDIARYFSPKLSRSIISKSVTAPKQVNHPRGWHSDIAHQRKLASYQVEARFYQNYADQCLQGCYVPQLIEYLKINEEQTIIIMEDLQELGYRDKRSLNTLSEIKQVIDWLTQFHARFLESNAEDLWSIGSYWHLATRQDEYNNMANSPLKEAAKFIDNSLNTAKFQTIIHGDAKLANFCFSDSNQSNHKTCEPVAAVDFQYVGKGVGVKDLAYFLGSCLTNDEVTGFHDELLDYYFFRLAKACNEYKQTINFAKLEAEWRKLYVFANADFHRFLLGWSPEHHKINRYLERQTELALGYFA